MGAGGSAKAIIPSLLKEDPQRISIGNRTVSKAEELLESFSSFRDKMNLFQMTDNLNFKPEILINSTSAGIQNQSLELPKDILTKDMCINDLSYSFDDTPFLKLVKSKGIENYYDGIGMLVHQAALSFKIWTVKMPKYSINIAELL